MANNSYREIGGGLGSIIATYLTKNLRKSDEEVDHLMGAFEDAKLTGSKEELERLGMEYGAKSIQKFEDESGKDWPGAPEPEFTGPPTGAQQEDMPWPTTPQGIDVRASHEQIAGRELPEAMRPNLSEAMDQVLSPTRTLSEPQERKRVYKAGQADFPHLEGKFPKLSFKEMERPEKITASMMGLMISTFDDLTSEDVFYLQDNGYLPKNKTFKLKGENTQPTIYEQEAFTRVYGPANLIPEAFETFKRTGRVIPGLAPMDRASQRAFNPSELNLLGEIAVASGRSDLFNIHDEIAADQFNFAPWIEFIKTKGEVASLITLAAQASKVKNTDEQVRLTKLIAGMLGQDYSETKSVWKKIIDGLAGRKAAEATGGGGMGSQPTEADILRNSALGKQKKQGTI